MADQQRWFKLWHSALSDDELQTLAPDLRWAWAALGCHTKVHGTRGRVVITRSNGVLAMEMGVPLPSLIAVIQRLPHVHVEEGNPDNGHVTVTWRNWSKYQEDSTVSARVARLRSKRRGEENKKRAEETPPLNTQSPPEEPWPDGIEEVRQRLVRIDAPAAFRNLEYWTRIDEWLGAEDSGVAYLVELDKYLAWIAGLPKNQQRRDHRRGFRNWLSKAERWATMEAQRRVQGQAQAKSRR